MSTHRGNGFRHRARVLLSRRFRTVCKRARSSVKDDPRTSGIIVEILGAPGSGKNELQRLLEHDLEFVWNTDIRLAEIPDSASIPVAPEPRRVFLELLRRQAERLLHSSDPFPHSLDLLAANALFAKRHFGIVSSGSESAGWFLYEGIFHHFADEILDILNCGGKTSEQLIEVLGPARCIVYLESSREAIYARLMARAEVDGFWNYARAWGLRLSEYVDRSIEVREALFSRLDELGYLTIPMRTDDPRQFQAADIQVLERRILRHFSRI